MPGDCNIAIKPDPGADIVRKIHGRPRIAAIFAPAVPTQKYGLKTQLECCGGSFRKKSSAVVSHRPAFDRPQAAWPDPGPHPIFVMRRRSSLAGGSSPMSCAAPTDALIFCQPVSLITICQQTACILQERLGLPQTCAAFGRKPGLCGILFTVFGCVA